MSPDVSPALWSWRPDGVVVVQERRSCAGLWSFFFFSSSTSLPVPLSKVHFPDISVLFWEPKVNRNNNAYTIFMKCVLQKCKGHIDSLETGKKNYLSFT